jgi:hypothetical protein
MTTSALTARFLFDSVHVSTNSEVDTILPRSLSTLKVSSASGYVKTPAMAFVLAA